MGRKALPHRENSEMITLRVNTDLKRRLKEISGVMGMTMNDFVMKILVARLSEMETDPAIAAMKAARRELAQFLQTDISRTQPPPAA